MKTKIFKQNPIYKKRKFVLGILSLTLLVIFNGITSCSTDETQTVANFHTITMQDEFDQDGAPNSSIWTYDIGGNGWGNNELQYYTDRSQNVAVQNGYLIITAEKENFEEASYTSARILSKGLFEQAYGRFEARIKLPWGQGIWPAFWLLGGDIDTNNWPNCGEIDIAEHVGNNPNTILGTLHYPGNSGGNANGDETVISNATSEFHDYEVQWTDSSIKFYVDGLEFHTFINSSNVPFNQDFFLILNTAMGGNLGGVIDPDFDQSTFEVDYIRVYQ